MADSKLVEYEDYTPNCDNGRDGEKPEYLVVHHTANIATIEECGMYFKNFKVSAHYCIGVDGRIAQYVREQDTAWSLGDHESNKKSINIEIVNCSSEPIWEVSDISIEKCIELICDICRRLGWTTLSYTGDMKGKLIKHSFVNATMCPGPYLGAKFGYICDEVNVRLKN